MSAPALNTRSARKVAAILLVGAGLLGGCGGGRSQDVNTVLRDAFHPSKPIASGQVNLAFGLTATGAASVQQPFSLRVQGPFESQGTGKLPRFALSVTVNTSGRPVSVGATATGSQLFLTLQGIPFVAPDSLYQQFKQGYTQSSAAQKGGGAATFASLGLDPRSWLIHPRVVGTSTVDGVAVEHVAAGLNLQQFLNDLGHISTQGGSLGAGAGLTAAQRTALGQSVKSANADVYIGRDDHFLRNLTVQAQLAAPASAGAALGGLRTGTLDLTLSFADVNRPVTISAPANAQPLSRLTQLLGASGGTGTGGLATGATGATGATASAAPPTSTGSSAPPTPAQQAYLQCTGRAGQDVAALQRCGPLLHGK